VRFLTASTCAALLLVLPLGTAAVVHGATNFPAGFEDRLVSLDLRQMDLRTALNLIAEQNNLNIVSGDEVLGEVTGHFDRVPVSEVLDSLLRACGYRYDTVGDIIVVTAADEKATRWGDTRVIQLYHADGMKVRTAVSKLLSARGSIQLYPEEIQQENMRVSGDKAGPEATVLIVHDEKTRVDEIAAVVEILDNAPKQLMIEVRLVETVIGNNVDIGFDWNVEASVDGNQTPQELPLDRDRFTFGTLSVAEFYGVLRSLDEDKKSRLISNPRITTEDNREARISVGTVVPVRTVSRFSESGVTQDLLTYEDKEINIELSVTPLVSGDGQITLMVEAVVQDIIGWTGEYNDQPITSKRELSTRVTVRDSETIAMGGLIKEAEIETISRVWILGRIPLLGRFFSNTIRTKETTDMLIFITPHIIK